MIRVIWCSKKVVFVIMQFLLQGVTLKCPMNRQTACPCLVHLSSSYTHFLNFIWKKERKDFRFSFYRAFNFIFFASFLYYIDNNIFLIILKIMTFFLFIQMKLNFISIFLWILLGENGRLSRTLFELSGTSKQFFLLSSIYIYYNYVNFSFSFSLLYRFPAAFQFLFIMNRNQFTRKIYSI